VIAFFAGVSYLLVRALRRRRRRTTTLVTAEAEA
jgi:hypothetical protein